QANLWTEYITEFKQVEYMLFPRLMALAEVGWGTNDPQNYNAFEDKAVNHFKYLDELGINYSKSIFNPSGKVIRKGNGIAYELSMSKDLHNIRYTTDGSEPKWNSNVYTEPIQVKEPMTIQAAYFEDGELKSSITRQ